MTKIRVGVVFGGKSGEHEVSLISARSIMSAMDPSRFEVVPIGITKEGEWLLTSDPMKALIDRSTNGHRALSSTDLPVDDDHQELQSPSIKISGASIPAVAVLPSGGKVDVVFPVLHGTYGEDGTIQGLFEMADVPYVGANVLASALGMDKALMKAVFQQAGLPVAKWHVVMRHRWEKDRHSALKEIEDCFSYPCFVKPSNSGSSVGISKAHDRSELETAIDLAITYDRKVLVEKGIDCREIECSVLGNDEPEASVLGEIVPVNEFYDYEAKYKDDRTLLIIPADLPDSSSRQIRQLAIKAFQAIDCCGMARVDFFVDKNDSTIYVNELNTIPGFTSVSMYPKLWEASGMPYPVLLERLVDLAIQRHQDKKRSKTSYNGH